MESAAEPASISQDRSDGGVDAAAASSRGWAGWLISGATHAVLLLIAMGICWAVQQPQIDYPPVRTQPAPPPKPREARIVQPQETQVDPVLVVDPVVADKVELTNTDPQQAANTSEDPDEAEAPQGDPSQLTRSDTGMDGLLTPIGGGGGGAGPNGVPNSGGILQIGVIYKVPPACPRTVNAALRWFKRHQGPDGAWDPVAYPRNCSDEPKCEPGVVNHGSIEGASAAMTGYALMCFLSAGYDHMTPNKYRSVVKRAIGYLLSIQQADGALGERNYENAIASMALSEALAMSGDATLRQPAQRAVDVILKRQNQAAPADGHDIGYGTGLGWDYAGPSDRNDSSVTGWNIMALKDAYAAGLKVGDGLENAKRWLEVAWKRQNPNGNPSTPTRASRASPIPA